MATLPFSGAWADQTASIFLGTKQKNSKNEEPPVRLGVTDVWIGDFESR